MASLQHHMEMISHYERSLEDPTLTDERREEILPRLQAHKDSFDKIRERNARKRSSGKSAAQIRIEAIDKRIARQQKIREYYVSMLDTNSEHFSAHIKNVDVRIEELNTERTRLSALA